MEIPKLTRDSSILNIQFRSCKREREKQIDGISMIVDFDSLSLEPVGVEIVNLKDKIKCEALRIPKYEDLNWEITYDDQYDVFYAKFQKKTSGKFLSKPTKGTVLIGDDINLVGLKISIA